MQRALISAAVLTLLLAAGSTADAQVSPGVQIGTPPPPPRAYRVPRQPGPEFDWVEGYWYANGKRWTWHDGYWTRPPFAGAYWVAPYYRDGRYFEGYWDGSRGRFDHKHQSDRDRDRDWRDSGHDRDHEHGRSS